MKTLDRIKAELISERLKMLSSREKAAKSLGISGRSLRIWVLKIKEIYPDIEIPEAKGSSLTNLEKYTRQQPIPYNKN